MKIPCNLVFDERTSTVTLLHAKTNTIQMVIKLEAGTEGTLKRCEPDVDCDNFWIAIKPADNLVLDERLFGRKKLKIKDIDFTLE